MERRTIERMVARAVWTLLLGVALTGCYYDNEEELYPFGGCNTSNVTWSGTIQPLITTRCATPGCHVQGGQPPNLGTYAAVKAQVDAGRIKARAIDGSPSFMPPSGKLPSCDIVALNTWLAAGAPEN
jgi:hypothetical protein